MDIITLAEDIMEGRRISRQDDLDIFLSCDLEKLCEGADRIRACLIGEKVDLCAIINGRSGRCPEDCKYCAQSVHPRHPHCFSTGKKAQTAGRDCPSWASTAVTRLSARCVLPVPSSIS